MISSFVLDAFTIYVIGLISSCINDLIIECTDYLRETFKIVLLCVGDAY